MSCTIEGLLRRFPAQTQARFDWLKARPELWSNFTKEQVENRKFHIPIKQAMRDANLYPASTNFCDISVKYLLKALFDEQCNNG